MSGCQSDGFDDGADSESADGRTSASPAYTNRRSVLASTLATTTLGLSGCAGFMGRDEGNVLEVAVWSGVFAERFEEVFATGYEDETGTTVNVNPAGAEILSEIRSAPEDDPPYDVVSADELFYHLGVNDDLYAELRHENVPNLENVYPFLREKPGQGTEHGAPVGGELLGISYASDSEPPTSWSDLYETDESVGFEGSFYIYPMMIAAMLSSERDGIEELYAEEHHDAVYDEMERLASNVELWTGSAAEIYNGIEQGTISKAMWYSGMGYSEANEHDQFSFAIPDDTGGYVNNYCPVRGTDRRDEAESFINYMLEPDVQTEWAETGFGFTATESSTYPDLTADAYPSTNDDLEAIQFANFDRLGEYASDLLDRFNEIRADS